MNDIEGFIKELILVIENRELENRYNEFKTKVLEFPHASIYHLDLLISKIQGDHKKTYQIFEKLAFWEVKQSVSFEINPEYADLNSEINELKSENIKLKYELITRTKT